MPSLTKVQSGFVEAQGALPLSSGTAAAPGLKFDDHAGTGMFSPSTGEIAFSTSGHSQAITFKTDGKVGIGTDTPAEKLEVYGNGRFKAADGSHGIELYPDVGGLGYQRIISFNRTSSAYENLSIGVNDFIVTNGSSSEALRITSGGNIGIGTYGPSQPITIKRESAGQGEFGVRLEYGNTNGPTLTNSAILVGSYGLKFKNYNSGRDFIFETGNVGIGTDNPASKLDILGILRLSRTSTYTSNVQLSITHEASSNYGSLYFDNSNATGDYVFRTTSSSTERLRITSGGNVGINETTPDSKLDILHSTSTNSATENLIHLRTDPGGGYVTRGLFVKIGRDGPYDNSAAHYDIVGSAGNSGFHAFEVQGDEKLRITSGGFVQIGDGSYNAEAPLHVISQNSQGINAIFGAKDFVVNNNYNYTDANIALQGRDIDNNDTGAGIQFTVRNLGNSNWLHGAITMDQSGNYIFKNGGAGNYVGTERLRITSGGNVGISDTTPQSGLSVRKYGSKFSNDNSTYYQPSGRIFTLVGAPANGEDSWFGMCGGYNNTSGSVNLLLQQNFNNTSQQAGCYIANEATGTAASALTFGHMYASSSVTGRPSKVERLRIDSAGILKLKTSGDTVDGTYFSSFTINNTGSSTWSRLRFDRSGSSRWGLALSTDDTFRISNLNLSGGGGADDDCFVINNSSNIGIQDATPSYRLDVNGSVRAQETGNGKGLLLHVNSGLSATANLMQIWTGQSNGISFHTNNSSGDQSGERWRINNSGHLYNTGDSGYSFYFKRYRGSMPSMTSNNWTTVANTTTVGDAGIYILSFGRFEQSNTGGSQWSVTYVSVPVYLHSSSGNDGEQVIIPLYHMGHYQGGSAAECRLTYYSGSAHSTGRVQFKPLGWNYTPGSTYYTFYKIANA